MESHEIPWNCIKLFMEFHETEVDGIFVNSWNFMKFDFDRDARNELVSMCGWSYYYYISGIVLSNVLILMGVRGLKIKQNTIINQTNKQASSNVINYSPGFKPASGVTGFDHIPTLISTEVRSGLPTVITAYSSRFP
jgi:hypothetical protein